jgi:predicted DCC family thiol-disulfide oxidoreductase YuxK
MIIPEHLLLFDGVCVLCNRSVQIVIKRDKSRKFRFASLQSDFGSKVLDGFNLDKTLTDSVIYVRSGNVYTKSDAALRIAKTFGGFWKMSVVFFIFPRFLRNIVYDFIARNRYRWFGKNRIVYDAG